MKKILIKAHPLFEDVVQLEPTLEALYYDNFPCSVTLKTFSEYIPFFEHHPLIEKVVGASLNEYEYDKVITVEKREELSEIVDTVSLFAISAGVKLIRKTPKIFIEGNPEDLDILVQARFTHSFSGDFPVFTGETFNSLKRIVLHHPSNQDDLRKQLSSMASASVVVGPDNWMTQAAAALDARVVIGIDAGKENLRAPFNTTVVGFSEASVYNAVKDTLYEKRYPDYLNRGNAAEFIKNKAKMYMKSNFVDVGSSRWPIPNGIAVDEHNREILENAPDEAFSGVFSSHCLEHIVDWEAELKLWHRILRKDGYMFLYLPHPRAEVWRAFTGSWVGSNHVWNPEPVTLVHHLKTELGMEIMEYTSRRDSLWSFYVIARKV